MIIEKLAVRQACFPACDERFREGQKKTRQGITPPFLKTEQNTAEQEGRNLKAKGEPRTMAKSGAGLLQCLDSQGCDLGQGFLSGLP